MGVAGHTNCCNWDRIRGNAACCRTVRESNLACALHCSALCMGMGCCSCRCQAPQGIRCMLLLQATVLVHLRLLTAGGLGLLNRVWSLRSSVVKGGGLN